MASLFGMFQIDITTIILILYGVIVSVILAVSGLFGWKYYQYRFRCILLLKRADGYTLEETKGRPLKFGNDMITTFKLWKKAYRKAHIDPIPSNYIYRKKRTILLVEVSPLHFVPQKFKYDEKAIEKFVTELNLDTSLSRIYHTKVTLHNTFGVLKFWDRYGTIITVIAIGIIMALGIILATDFMLKVFTTTINKLTPLLRDLTSIKGSLETIANTVPKTPPLDVPI